MSVKEFHLPAQRQVNVFLTTAFLILLAAAGVKNFFYLSQETFWIV